MLLKAIHRQHLVNIISAVFFVFAFKIVKKAHGAIRVKVRVLVCQSKLYDNRRLRQNIYLCVINFSLSENSYFSVSLLIKNLLKEF